VAFLVQLRGLILASHGQFSDNGCVLIASQAAEVQGFVASRRQFSGVTVLYQATEEKPNGSSVESGQGTLVRCLFAALHNGYN